MDTTPLPIGQPNPLLDDLRQRARQSMQANPPQIQMMPPPGGDNGQAPAISEAEHPMQTMDNVATQSQSAGLNAPPGSFNREVANRNKLIGDKPGAGQIYGKITGSNFGQNHPLAGKLLGGLAQGAASAGDILGSSLAGVAPQLVPLVQAIPGTTMHHNELVRRSDQNINQMQGEQQKTAQTRLEGAQAENLENPNQQALPTEQGYQAYNPKTGTANPIKDQSGNVLDPIEKPNKETTLQTLHANAVNKAIQEGRDPSTDPTVQHLADAITSLQKETAPKSREKVNLMDAKTKQPYAANFEPTSGKYFDAAGKEIINPVPYEKPMNISVGAGEKTFEYSDKQLEALAKPLRERSDRIERLRVTMSQGNPQADALIGPELLTAMAGGQGSGLRMNEAEISRIVGGRSQWENLKANLQHWSTNPQDARSITPDQDAMIRKLVEAINDKVQRKMTILNDAGSKIVDIQDPKQQHKLIADTRRALQQEDAAEKETKEYQGHTYEKGDDGQWHLQQKPKQ